MNKITMVIIALMGFCLSFFASQKFINDVDIAYVPKPPSVMTVVEQRILQVNTPDELLQAFSIIGGAEKNRAVERLEYEISQSKDRKEIFYKLQFIRFVKGEATYSDAQDLLKSIRYSHENY
jgi:hypothetical protein